MGQEIQITAADGGKFAAYLALPSRTPAPGLVVLPKVFNTNPHIRSVAGGYAAEGFVVMAPDVYWRQEAGCYKSYTDEGRAKAQSLRARLDTDQFARALGDVIAALRARPDCTGKVGVMGFCLGDKFAYLSSTRHAIDAAVSYYGVQIARPLYRGRARIEHAVGKLKRFKRVPLRCEKTAQNHASFVALACGFTLIKSVHRS